MKSWRRTISRNSTLQYFLADQYIEAGRLKDAEKLINDVLKDTGNPEGYVGLAALYRKQNKPEQLLDVLAKGFQGQRGLDRLDVLLSEMQTDAPLVDSLIAAARKIEGVRKGQDRFLHGLSRRPAGGRDAADRRGHRVLQHGHAGRVARRRPDWPTRSPSNSC